MELDNELFRNGSGYADITAYKALINISKGENNMGFKRGEIFEYEQTNGDIRTALVVAADFRSNDKFISIILLTDEPKGQINVPINTICGIMYADCGMVSIATNNRLLNYLKTAKDEEMAQIDEGIAKCLGLEQKVVEVPVEKVVEVEATSTFDMWDEYDRIKQENASLQGKAEVFEKLYKDLLADVMKG